MSKTKVAQVKLSEQEYSAVKSAAQKENLPLSIWARRVLLAVVAPIKTAGQHAQAPTKQARGAK